MVEQSTHALDRAPFYRARIVIRSTADIRVQPYQGGALYALIASAYGRATNSQAFFPDGLILDVPEQSRTQVDCGESFAFGLTLFQDNEETASRLLQTIVDGLHQLAGDPPQLRQPFGGNFIIDHVEDLVTASILSKGDRLQPIPREIIEHEFQQLISGDYELITLRFTSPVRLERPKRYRMAGHGYFDREWFNAKFFLQRLFARLASLDQQTGRICPKQILDNHPMTVVDNQLCWLDIAYGQRTSRKTLGGAVGRLKIKVSSSEALRALVWGQYARIGKSTRFGFGAYRLIEAGPDPFPCHRSIGLLTLATTDTKLSPIAEKVDLPSGEAIAAGEKIRTGTYTPSLSHRIQIKAGDSQVRTLAVPSPVDLVLQRGVYNQIGPALDQFFETSSFAWRRGLSRDAAARAIARAYQDGCTWAIRQDFDRYFESIDHRELRLRLETYLGDDAVTDLIMCWVASGSATANRGIPTGSPLSPLLGNLFLDNFDETIAANGGRLVRYGDDFLILFRDPEEANRFVTVSATAARNLCLKLNEDGDKTTALLNLQDGFDFLGFRFERHEGWAITSDNRPRRLDQLQWSNARHAPQQQANRQVHLPGESEADADEEQTTVMVGPGVKRVSVHDKDLRFSYSHGMPDRLVELDGTADLLVIGQPDIPAEVAQRLAASGTRLTCLHDNLDTAWVIAGAGLLDTVDPDAISALTIAVNDHEQRLTFARQLISAKLHNYAVYATALEDHASKYPPAKSTSPVSDALENSARQAADAESLEALLGIEGAAAARWYRFFRHQLAGEFRFERRIAPNARDPVNVMLNIGHTMLYRMAAHAVRAAGLSLNLGLLHQRRPGHDALASDLQEPFRFLIDRTVLEATATLHPRQFHRTRRGIFPLSLDANARRSLLYMFHCNLACQCQPDYRQTPSSYRHHLIAQARSLRRHLLDTDQPFESFRLP